MFTQTLEELCSCDHLRLALDSLPGRAEGIDGLSLDSFKKQNGALEKLSEALVRETFSPLPLQMYAMPKRSGGTRGITLSSVSDKTVQKCLLQQITPYFERLFSRHSYGYRPARGPLQAIRRTDALLHQGNPWIFRADIHSFFDSIPHDKMLDLLYAHISDMRLVRLLELFMENGAFGKHNRYSAAQRGIHQGDILSPLLANLYLDRLDRFLENQAIAFVRYADDLILFAQTDEAVKQARGNVETYLDILQLSFNPEKSVIANTASQPFDFLGIRFFNSGHAIAPKRFEEKLQTVETLDFAYEDFEKFREKSNAFIEGFSRYYKRILDDGTDQIAQLHDTHVKTLQRVVEKLRSEDPSLASEALIHRFESLVLFIPERKKELLDALRQTVRSLSEKSVTSKITRQKRRYTASLALNATLHVNGFGTSLGLHNGTIQVRKQGKIDKTVSLSRCERIIIESKGVSVSSNLVFAAAENGIPIDYIDSHSYSVATLGGMKHNYAKTSLLQLEWIQSGRALEPAMRFVEGKIRNQLNYLKRLNLTRGHLLDDDIARVARNLHGALRKAQNIAELMGYEGNAADAYWHAVSQVIDHGLNFPGRRTQNASDLLNNALNYGYAILYGRVRHHAVRAGLALNISFLHALSDNKPTLTFDLIEEFRTYVVDRTIIGMLNRNESLHLSDARLDTASRRKISAQITRRLNTYTNFKGSSSTTDSIIASQAFSLLHHLQGEGRYRPFRGAF